jgi:serine/threonine-protein kinase
MGIKCPKCQTDNPDTQKFCGECATPLPSSKEIPVTETLETAKEELTTGLALKLIKPEIAADKKTIERFRNELKTARDISHKNICRMYDLNKEEGSYYITMEYIEGQDLKSLVRQTGQLAIPTTISIAKQVCEGLSEAHKLGTVHRDLKPSNIMIDKEGNARIMDFGIARSLTAKGITGAGVMIGTPEYMSPEQAEVKDVDQRSDIYSLGVILYEMVTGRVPFEGETPLGIAMKHKSEVPKDPREHNAQIPEDFSQMILKCMGKDKEKRYQSAGDMRTELENIEKGIPTTERVVPKRKPITSKEITVTFGLKKLSVPVLVIAVIIVVLIIWRPWSPKELITSSKHMPSLAVLPFEDLSPKKDQSYFCEGLADELINRLSRIGNLRIPARTSSFLVKSRGLDIKDVGEELNVENVLEGSIRKEGKMLRITVQLINVAEGSSIWSERFEGYMGDVFNLQDKISLAIVNNLEIKLLGEEKTQLVKRDTKNIEAYNLYLQGRFFWNKRTEEGFRKAIENFEGAIDKDTTYARAWTGLSDCYSIFPLYLSTPPDIAFPKAKEAVLKALEIDEKMAEAHVSLAYIKMSYDWDWKGADKEFKRAIKLNPGYSTAHHWYAIYLSYMGRHNEAIAEIKLALDLDPFSLVINKDLAFRYILARQYDNAIKVLQRALEMNPNFPMLHSTLGLAYLGKSMFEEALKEFQKEEKLFLREMGPWIGIAYAKMGKTDEAHKVLAELIEQLEKIYIPSSLIALIYFSLGENDKGFKWLDKAYEERDYFIRILKVDPNVDSVRSDPRFKALLKKVNLE